LELVAVAQYLLSGNGPEGFIFSPTSNSTAILNVANDEEAIAIGEALMALPSMQDHAGSMMVQRMDAPVIFNES
jgi:hypothetical protein